MGDAAEVVNAARAMAEAKVDHVEEVLRQKPPGVKLTDDEKDMLADARGSMAGLREALEVYVDQVLADLTPPPPRRKWWQLWKREAR